MTMLKKTLFIAFLFCFQAILIYSQIFEPVKPVMILKKQDGAIQSLAFSPDGKLLASGSKDKTCQLWSYPEGKPLNTIAGYVTGVQSLLFTPDNQFLCMAVDKYIRVFKLSGEMVYSHQFSQTQLWSMAYNSTTNQFSAGNYEKVAKTIDFNTGKVVKSFTGHTKNMLAVAFSPNGKYLTSGSLDQTVKIWDLASNKELFTYTGHFGNIFSVCFTPDSKKLISASEDKTIRIWDVTTGEWLKTLSGHDEAIAQVVVTPDGNYILSASADATVKLWDILSGECIHTFEGHKEIVYSIAVTPDGKAFASGSNDKTILIWKLAPDIFAEHYFAKEMEDEANASGLFEPRKDGETKADYKTRQAKADEFRKTLIEKYYQKYMNEIRGKLPQTIK
jgi:WD40 repeat protein